MSNARNVSTLGDYLRSRRRYLGLSGAAIEQLTNGAVTRNVVSKLENGYKQDITLGQAARLATALDVPVGSVIQAATDQGGGEA